MYIHAATDIFASAAQTLAAAQILRIYFGPTEPPRPVIATLGHRAEISLNRPPRPPPPPRVSPPREADPGLCAYRAASHFLFVLIRFL